MYFHNDFRVKADEPDWRDRYYNFARIESPRDIVDLRKWASPIEDQLHLGSCVGQAVVGAYELLINKADRKKFTDLSRLFVYYNARLLDDAVDEDVGAYTRDGIKAVNKYGVCSEAAWPYIIERFANTPSVQSYEDARHRLIKKYYRIQNIKDIVDALNADSPVVTSMNVYDSFFELDDGRKTILPMPRANENIIGGHAVSFVGYNLPKRLFLARNSFGTNWGDQGYFWVPFDYAEKDFMDNWTFDIELN
jgi:C1A family cysteine protease